MDAYDVTKIIKQNRKRFECPESFFAEDSGLSIYKNQKLKVLVLFLSNIRYRSSSNTFNILQDVISSYGDVFVDFCYFPYPDDIPLYDELNIPYVRGARSGFLIKDFDIVLVSIAVLKEAVNLPVIYNHDSIPMGVSERRRQNYPIIAMGGSSAQVLGILCGGFILNGVRDKSLVDIVNFGKAGESIKELIQGCLELVYRGSSCSFVIDKLSSCWLNCSKLDFVYDSKGYIIGERSGQKVVFDSGDEVTENFNHKILNIDGSFVDRADVLISYGCAGRGHCSFCLEGSVGGCWKEKSISDIERDILSSKINVWQESCGIFSYNANYHSQIEHIADLIPKYFDRSSVLMSRADVYSQSTKYLDICKKLGAIKLSIAAEGMSDSIRNKFLNKRLSRKQLHDAVHNLMDNSILTIKINYILTGKETEQDFQEWLDDIKSMLEYKKEHSYKTRLFLTITNLIVYDFTPLRYEERTMALHSLEYKDDSFIELFLEYSKQISGLGVGVTLYGSGAVSAFEQLILDLGYMGTSILVNSVVKDGLRYDRDVTKSMCQKFFKRVETTYDIRELFKERSCDAWFSSHLVESGALKKIEGKQESYEDYSCESCVNPDCAQHSADACGL